jgi:glutathione synthase/RimK-type ligase-like ATP-grasp enzyme
LKRAKEGDFRVQRDFGGYIEKATPSASLVEQAQRVVESVEGALLYARVDAIDVDGSLVLMELELIDPVLFFGTTHQAAERFVDVLIETVSASAQGA